MSTETVLVSEVIPVTKERLYAAWLDSDQHTAITANTAAIEPYVGGSHSAFGGYATGQVLALEPNRRIVQSWRSSDFPSEAADSRLEVTFEDTAGGTMITLLHTGIPTGQSDRYRDGWLNYYFERMKRYFGDTGDESDEGDDEDATDVESDEELTEDVTQVMPVVRGAAAHGGDDDDDDDEAGMHNGTRSAARRPSSSSPPAPPPAPRAATASARRPRPAVTVKAKPKAKARPAARKPAARKPAAKAKMKVKVKAKAKTAAKKATRRPMKKAKAKARAKPKAKAKPAKKRGRR
jgi:uncharacterized protein YndB with AHSA1/START domain